MPTSDAKYFSKENKEELSRLVRFLKRSKNIKKKLKGSVSDREAQRIAFKGLSKQDLRKSKVSSSGLKNKDAVLDKGMATSLEHERRKK